MGSCKSADTYIKAFLYLYFFNYILIDNSKIFKTDFVTGKKAIFGSVSTKFLLSQSLRSL